MPEKQTWPLIKDLPIERQEPFRRWLRGQKYPIIEGLPALGWDAYYPWDYERFVAGLSVID